MDFLLLVVVLQVHSCWSVQANKLKKKVLLAIADAEMHYDREHKTFHDFHIKYSKLTKFSRKISKRDYIAKLAEGILMDRENIDQEAVRDILSKSLPTIKPTQRSGLCKPSKYRTFDGSCNNIFNPEWGTSDSPYERLMPPEYEDKMGIPRGGLSQANLPNPRHLSDHIHSDSVNSSSTILSALVPQFGQFVGHDMTFSSVDATDCCMTSKHPYCWPISIPENDTFYSSFAKNCLGFSRSVPYPGRTVREQINGVTSFIDGSTIYGSRTERSNLLRSFHNEYMSTGFLKTQFKYRGWLPLTSEIGLDLPGELAAGDDRVNEMPGLTALHNQHNRIAAEFNDHTDWDDERIYQETRRIIIATLQKIIYNDFLPIVLGKFTMKKFGLISTDRSLYQPTLNPGIFNSFGTAAFRFGHSLVPQNFPLVKRNDHLRTVYFLEDEYFKLRMLGLDEGLGFEYDLRGLMFGKSFQFDPYATSSLTKYLFKRDYSPYGDDLVALNIQRGRDHGIPGYNSFRKLCSLPQIKKWSDSPIEINKDWWSKLKSIYTNWNDSLSPADVDVYTAGLMESPKQDGIVGPTFNCIMAIQFYKLKYGDRYFFTHENQDGSFSKEQLKQILSRTLENILCDNTMEPTLSWNVFRQPSPSNPLVSCSRLSGSLDLTPFIHN